MSTPPSNRILIVGDAGRGKSTFGKKLSLKLNISSYETDDFYWKTKFSEPAIKEESIKAISRVYAQEKWIMNGTTRHLIQEAFEKADRIYVLKFKSIIPQYYYLIKRTFGRKHESWSSLWELLVHITRKRFKKGYRTHLPSLDDLLKPYEFKVVHLYSLKDIEGELSKVLTH